MANVTIAIVLAATLLSATDAFGEVDSMLPKDICTFLGASDCTSLTEEQTQARYVDLNGDGTKELIFSHGGGSCGSNYRVFELDESVKWKDIGGWCGCEDGLFQINKTNHNGYLDIWTCGYTGFFDGKRYVGYRQ